MSTKNIKTLIEADVKYNPTPDLTELRYFNKPIPVFFWDDLQDHSTLSSVLSPIDLKSNYESKFYNALTVNKYVPWYNMDDSSDSYAAYCLEEYDDLVFLDVPSYTVSEPLPLRGKVSYVSLAALQELDFYYENQHIFTRYPISVYPSLWSKTPQKAYTWFNSVDQISSFDNATSEYVLDKNLDLTPFSDKSSSGLPTKYYEM